VILVKKLNKMFNNTVFL